MLRPVRVTGPAATPVSLAEIKAHCRVDSSDEDTLLGALLQAAVDHLDGWSGVLGRCLVSQTWRLPLEAWPSGALRLPFPDVSAVGSVVYADALGAEQTLSAALYVLHEDGLGAWLRWSDSFSAPALEADNGAPVAVTFTAGWADAAAVPAPIKAAIKLLVGHWYEHREAASSGTLSPLPMAVDALLWPYRRIGP